MKEDESAEQGRLLARVGLFSEGDGAGAFEGVEGSFVELEGNGGDEIVELGDAGGAGDRRGYRGAGEEPGDGDLGGSCVMEFGDLVERAEDALAAFVQVFFDEIAAGFSGEIGFGAVFAGEKSAGEGKVGDGGNFVFRAEGLEFVFEAGAVVEVVFGLEGFVAGEVVFVADGEGLAEAGGGVIRGTDGADFSGLDEVGEGGKSFFEGSVGIVLVGLVEIDVIGLEAAEGIFGGSDDVGAG